MATHKLTNLSYRLKTTAVYSSGLNFLSSMPKALSLISSARYYTLLLHISSKQFLQDVAEHVFNLSERSEQADLCLRPAWAYIARLCPKKIK